MVETQTKEFDTFMKVLAQLEDRVMSLQKLGDELISNGHMERKQIKVLKEKVILKVKLPKF